MEHEIRLREHEKRRVNLSQAQLTAVRQVLSGRLEVWPTEDAGWYELRTSSYVGFVNLPGGLVLVIEPKVTIQTLFALLAAVYDPAHDVFLDEPQTYTTVEALFEFVVRKFASHVEDLIARGILRDYQSITDDPVAVRGRLLMAETLHRRPVLRDRHWCRYSQFTRDVNENRILRWTALCLQPYRYRETALSGRLRRIGRAFSDVTLDPESLRLFERLEYHRLNDPYRPALALARLLLDHLTFSGTIGGEPFLSYLVDMNWLFQRYVGAVLGREAIRWDIQMLEEDSRFLDTGRRVTIRPDVILSRSGKSLLVLDAKYKLEAAQVDLYQALAYCHALGLSNAVLVHPESEQAPAGLVRIVGPGDVCVQYLSLNLSGGPADLEAQGWALAGRVEKMLNMDSRLPRSNGL